ncbi:MAG: ACT domain-containing protein [Firmicutes bacterium]|nr:ACT domain-containing protein [Bacillota bacterium]
MTVQQISVFVENRPGQLAEFTKLLEEKNIDLRALSMAEAEDFGILRIIVDDTYNTIQTLKNAGYICSVTPVVAVEIEDKPGSLVKVVHTLAEGGINLEYTYAFLTSKKAAAYVIFRVADSDAAVEILRKAGIKVVSQEELETLF